MVQLALVYPFLDNRLDDPDLHGLDRLDPNATTAMINLLRRRAMSGVGTPFGWHAA
jgi:hypothetical protein